MTYANTKKLVKILGLFLPGLNFRGTENPHRMWGKNKGWVKTTPL